LVERERKKKEVLVGVERNERGAGRESNIPAKNKQEPKAIAKHLAIYGWHEKIHGAN